MVILTANLTAATSSKVASLLNAAVGWAFTICGEEMWATPSTTKVQDIWRSKKHSNKQTWLTPKWFHSWIFATKATKPEKYVEDLANLQRNLLSVKVTSASRALIHCTLHQLHRIEEVTRGPFLLARGVGWSKGGSRQEWIQNNLDTLGLPGNSNQFSCSIPFFDQAILIESYI